MRRGNRRLPQDISNIATPSREQPPRSESSRAFSLQNAAMPAFSRRSSERTRSILASTDFSVGPVLAPGRNAQFGESAIDACNHNAANG